MGRSKGKQRYVAKRRKRKSLTCAEAWKKVEKTAHRLSVSWHLTDNEDKRVSKAFSLLQRRPESRQKYQLFLFDVRLKCGLQGVRLCAIALGNDNVRDMNSDHRMALLQKLGEHKDLFDNPSFPSFANDTPVAEMLKEQQPHQIPTSQSEGHRSLLYLTETKETASPSNFSANNGNEDRSISSIKHLLNSGPVFSHDNRGQSDRDTTEDYSLQGSPEAQKHTGASDHNCQANQYFAENHSRFTQDDRQDDLDITNTQEIFEHASLDGVATVFDGLICGAIRTTSFLANGKRFTRASVTTVFPPWGGPVDCLLSLDICISSVPQLAMALFNATVKWMGNSFHISFEQGTTLTVPSSEVTLKGVGDAAIAEVFGSEIQQAIQESRIRLKELEGGKLMTECVSMIVTEKDAIVSLSLGLVRGLEIKKKLYT
ncbi:uncharacterized protein BDW70DRAFT_145998 [Aspergillus foveolatus]|uniref:uncharacterized protein n=1 Tax=Aspergillus foveolatus TaxID=210207 RepID=UPI003CCCF370